MSSEALLGFPRLAICTANLHGHIISIESRPGDGDPRRGLTRAAKQTVSNEATADGTAAGYTTAATEMYSPLPPPRLALQKPSLGSLQGVRAAEQHHDIARLKTRLRTWFVRADAAPAHRRHLCA